MIHPLVIEICILFDWSRDVTQGPRYWNPLFSWIKMLYFRVKTKKNAWKLTISLIEKTIQKCYSKYRSAFSCRENSNFLFLSVEIIHFHILSAIQKWYLKRCGAYSCWENSIFLFLGVKTMHFHILSTIQKWYFKCRSASSCREISIF